MKRWYVAYTQANGEGRAALNLQRQGFEAYLPCYSKERRHARRIERISRPLFPRYIFVRFDIDNDQWRSVNGTFGISHLVSHGNMPLPIPEEIIEDIQRHENKDGLFVMRVPVYQPGQRLEVVEGPLAMHRGRFKRMTDDERVVLLLDLLGRQVRVTMPHIAVTAA